MTEMQEKQEEWSKKNSKISHATPINKFSLKKVNDLYEESKKNKWNKLAECIGIEEWTKKSIEIKSKDDVIGNS